MHLSQQRCVACRPDSPVVTPEEATELRADIPEWRQTEQEGVPRLARTFHFASEAAAQEFVARLKTLADQEDHHPRIRTDGADVAVQWWTHAIRNLHRNDFIMAAKTDALYQSIAVS
jgi:4a-hydroxytetrahydrobiopterin dehydratase